jgi:glycosyltransferase involved in cell wall biosynthesis
MKILIAGNLANMGYEIAYAMRKKGIDVDLLLPKFPLKTEDPKTMYPELEKTGYPEWLIRFDNTNKSLGFNNWKFQIIREMRKKHYDGMIAMTEFPIFAIFSGKPYALLSTGSDMRTLFFEKSLKGFLYRLSYKKAKIIIWGEPDKLSLIDKLKLSKKAVFVNAPRNVEIYPQKIEKGDLKNKFVIFHPVAQDWKIKKNEIFIRAYNKLCAKRDDIFLILSDRGPDIDKTKKILFDGYANNRFQFVPYLDSIKLQHYYNLSDVIVDQFALGSFGMITVEAMKCAKPVLVKIDEKSFSVCYETIPTGIINIDSEDGIFDALNKLASDRKLVEELGNRNKEWIEKNWDIDLLTNKYIDICKKLSFRKFDT